MVRLIDKWGPFGPKEQFRSRPLEHVVVTFFFFFLLAKER